MSRITLDGNIGCGKTFYLKQLEKDGVCAHYDDSSSLTSKYRSNPQRYALAYYLNLLGMGVGAVGASLWAQSAPAPIPPQPSVQGRGAMGGTVGSPHLFEGSPYTFDRVQCQLLRENGSFDPVEYQVYRTYMESLGWTPDVIIYLTCHPTICYDRCHHSVPLEYLRDLHIKYEMLFDELNCPVTLYKVNAQEDPETVLNNIRDILTKRSSI